MPGLKELPAAFLAEHFYIGLEDIAVVVRFPVRDVVRKLALGQHLARLKREGAQETKFSPGEGNRHPVGCCERLTRLIQSEVARAQRSARGGLAATDQRVEAGDQLLNIQRLAQVIIGTSLEPVDSFMLDIPCREDQDWDRVACGAPVLLKRPALSIQVIPGPALRRHHKARYAPALGGETISGDIHRKASLGQGASQALDEGFTYGSPIFKAVQKKQCKALYTALKKSPKSPEYAVGEGSGWSHVDRSVAVLR